MSGFRELEFSGRGAHPKTLCEAHRPEKAAQFTFLPKATSLARGHGQAFGDAALNRDGLVLSERLDRFLAFDQKNGTVKVQPGITFADILDVMLPRGWTLPVIPDTSRVSAGGAVACDVYGLNHFQQGSLGRHILAFSLQTPDGTTHECSSTHNSELFQATLGGMGMTGFIKDVTFKLKPISSLSLQVEVKKIRNLQEMVEALEDARKTHEYTLASINHSAKGSRLGAGYFQKANHLKTGGLPLQSPRPQNQKRGLPSCCPRFLHRFFEQRGNGTVCFRASSHGTEKTISLDQLFQRLDNQSQVKKLYGKKGFLRCQFLIPQSPDAVTHLKDLISLTHERQQASLRCLMTYFGDHQGLLSFPGPGYGLALDFPHTPAAQTLCEDLGERVGDMGGRVDLACDALVTPERFEKMYAHVLPRWREILHQVDPQRRLNSLMAQRLNFRGEKHG